MIVTRGHGYYLVILLPLSCLAQQAHITAGCEHGLFTSGPVVDHFEVRPAKEPALKEYDIDDAYADSCVCNIEDVVEEGEFVTANKRQPGWETGMYQWEIKHIDHPAVKKAGIAMGGEYACDMGIGAFLENQSVEKAVDKVAQRAGKDQGGANDEMRMIFFFNDPLDIEAAKQYGHQAEEGEQQLAPAAAELESRRHSFILDEVKLCVAAHQVNAMVQRQMRLDPYLERLVCYDNEQHEQEYVTGSHK
jgi:hypothetical protein